MKTPSFLLRFSSTERAVHWTYAVCFLALLATGLIMYLPVLSALVPSRLILRQVHLAAAFFIVTVPTLIGLFGDRHSVAVDAQAVDRWDADDRAWVADGFAGRPSEAGRFNAGQKANAAFTVGSLLVFVGTGIIMTLNIFTRILPDWLVGNASLIHDSLTWVALFAWLGHVFLAGIYPPTRESLRGMVTGFVRSEWAAHHHPRWWDDQMAMQSADDGSDNPPATTIAPGGSNRHVS